MHKILGSLRTATPTAVLSIPRRMAALFLAFLLAVFLFPVTASAEDGAATSSNQQSTPTEVVLQNDNSDQQNGTVDGQEGTPHQQIGASDQQDNELDQQDFSGSQLSPETKTDPDAVLDAESTPDDASSAIQLLNVTDGYTASDTASGAPIPGSPFDSLSEAVSSCYQASPTGNFTITVEADDSAMGSPVSIPSGLTIILTSDSGSHVITQSMTSTAPNQTRHFNVEGTLILSSVTLRGPTSTTEYSGGVFVNEGALYLQDNAKIEGCNAQNGGAIHAYNSIVSLSDSAMITGNSASIGGGGIALVNTEFIMLGGTITKNAAAEGGAMACRGGSFSIQTAQGGSSLISDNSADDVGGLFIQNVSMVALQDVMVSGNSATTGNTGGIYIQTDNTLVSFVMHNVTVSNNTAETGSAGGMYLGHYITSELPNYIVFEFQSCTFENNIAAEEGGGLIISTSYEDTIGAGPTTENNLFVFADTTFTENSANIGGGLSFDSSEVGMDIQFIRSEISGNLADQGGGICFDLEGAQAYLDLTESSVKSNHAESYGGGLFLLTNADLLLQGGTITENTAGQFGGGVCVTEAASFTMRSILGEPVTAIYRNQADLGNPSAAGDDIFTSGDDASISLVPANEMPLPNGIPTSWFYDNNNARYRSGASEGEYTPIIEDTQKMGLTLGYEVHVTYDANGGNGTYSDTVTASSPYSVQEIETTGITRPGYTFAGWSTEANGDGTFYTPGDTIQPGEDMTLYAQWIQDPVDPDPPKPADPPQADKLVKTDDASGQIIVLAIGSLVLATTAVTVLFAGRKRGSHS